MDDVLDNACSIALLAAFLIALMGYAKSGRSSGAASARVEREQALPVVGRAPMHAVYRLLVPLAKAFVTLRISANALSVFALFLAIVAAMAFGDGRFGVGAAIACSASLFDGLDGLVARASGTESRFGKVLDTTIDRYVDALFLGGLAVYVRHELLALIVVLAAMLGSFMVSYASSIERELGHVGLTDAAPMRRAHRLAYLLTGAALGPLAVMVAGDQSPRAGAFPMLLAASLIAVFGNFSAVRRIFAAANAPEPQESADAPDGAPVARR